MRPRETEAPEGHKAVTKEELGLWLLFSLLYGFPSSLLQRDPLYLLGELLGFLQKKGCVSFLGWAGSREQTTPPLPSKLEPMPYICRCVGMVRLPLDLGLSLLQLSQNSAGEQVLSG